MTTFVIAIGVTRYSDTEPILNFADTDAMQFAELLGRRYGCVVKQFIDDENTYCAVQTQLALWTDVVAPGDGFIFYYSGHGHLTQSGMALHMPCRHLERDEHDLHPDSFLQEPDLVNWTTGGNWDKMVHLWILDACRVTAPIDQSKAIAFGAYRTRSCVYACQPNTLASQRHRLRGGVLTHYLLQELCIKGGALELSKAFFEKIQRTVAQRDKQEPEIVWGRPAFAPRHICLENSQFSAENGTFGNNTLWEMVATWHKPEGYAFYLRNAPPGAEFLRVALRFTTTSEKEWSIVIGMVLKEMSAEVQKRWQKLLTKIPQQEPPFSPSEFLISTSGRFQDKPGDFHSPAMRLIDKGHYFVTGKTRADLNQFELLKPLAYGRFPITVAQYLNLVPDARLKNVKGRAFLHNDFPMTNVSRREAEEFCVRLTAEVNKYRKELGLALLAKGCEYRLPTEAEWEIGARAGGKTWYSISPRPFDNDGYVNVIDEKEANIKGGKSIWRTPGPDCVDRYLPNKWGIYSCHGNVHEMTASTINGKVRLKGGAYSSIAKDVAACARTSMSVADKGLGVVGFRIVRNVDESERKK